MMMFDKHPNIVGWSSETVSIPYRNPLTGRFTLYVPDFLVVYVDRDGKQHIEMIEVKPLKETPGYQRVSEKTNRKMPLSKKDQAAQAVNFVKWEAARSFCSKRGITFRVVTEQSLFGK